MNPRDCYDAWFRRYGAEYGVPWRLLKAQAIAESGLNPAAVSPKGARGLCQFMPATWAEWSEPGDDPFDPEAAIRAQAKYMRWLLARTSGPREALAAYNWGLRHVRESGGQWPRETRDYVDKVVKLWEAM